MSTSVREPGSGKEAGGILRQADGLDRRRGGQVRGLTCTLDQGSFAIRLYGAEGLSVEIYGGKAKDDLFEAAFGCTLMLTEKPLPAGALPGKA